MMLASDSGSARSTARRSSPAGNGFLRRVLPFSPTRAQQPAVGGRAQHFAFLHYRGQIVRVALAALVLAWVGVRHFSSPVPASRIGVGNAELREDLAFQRFHRLGVVIVLVVITNEV